jgi:hypothetical protein
LYMDMSWRLWTTLWSVGVQLMKNIHLFQHILIPNWWGVPHHQPIENTASSATAPAKGGYGCKQVDWEVWQ